MSSNKEKQCDLCKEIFSCTASADNKGCWCFDYPFILDTKLAGDCLCPNCLKTKCTLKIDEYVATISPENAYQNLAKDLPKTNALINDIDYYIANGNYVFKPWFHLKRGFCCGNNCRHCPYQLKNN